MVETSRTGEGGGGRVVVETGGVGGRERRNGGVGDRWNRRRKKR